MAPSLPINGYLYIAFGDEHRGEAINSVNRLRQVSPNAHVSVITETRIHGFDNIIIQPQNLGLKGKVAALDAIYEHTFFVDTDTYFVDDCSELFQLLFHFDLCAMLDPAETELQPGLQNFNTGVLLLKQSALMTRCLDLFRKYYSSKYEALLANHPGKRVGSDQPFFTAAVRDSEVRVCPLSSSYNCRYRFAISLMGRVKLIHGNYTDFDDLQKTLNKSLGNRVWNRKGMR